MDEKRKEERVGLLKEFNELEKNLEKAVYKKTFFENAYSKMRKGFLGGNYST